ncbi:MAG: D-glycero-beta-D-manno-heptose 1,7-bisphosphate 7-phosphatase [Rhodocyclaceae bacterium]|nr:D-glycero-beta-D-manno-heptose 1,7-bisphosphate 7-phosphatase [Rhodocyclaceae bacterium]MDZ4216197.1 D-glycero-beta-D-manno-heptose 1,7-bisphosphate 7-phosphatase [Rhodocyclaceae bacterium]
MGTKLIILDRDGVINKDSDLYIKSPEEWVPLPGSLEAIARLNQWGWRVVVCTNQSGIGRGLFGMDTLNAIHEKMIKAAAHAGGSIDAIFYCPHTNADKCHCRKPKPGMLEEIASRYNVPLAGVPVVGDALRDLQAALAVGARPLLVLTGKGQKTRIDPALPPDIPVFADLAEAVKSLTTDK